MLLTSIPIQNYQNINSFNLDATQWTVRQFEAYTLYYQIADINQDYLRFIPLGDPVSMTVTFTGNYLYDQQLSNCYYAPNPTVKIATQVSECGDGSIWSINILATDKIYSGNVYFSLNNGGVISSWIGQGLLSVQDTGTDCGGC